MPSDDPLAPLQGDADDDANVREYLRSAFEEAELRKDRTARESVWTAIVAGIIGGLLIAVLIVFLVAGHSSHSAGIWASTVGLLGSSGVSLGSLLLWRAASSGSKALKMLQDNPPNIKDRAPEADNGE
jgi:high-affinity Fe2+/Pb2+ permease